MIPTVRPSTPAAGNAAATQPAREEFVAELANALEAVLGLGGRPDGSLVERAIRDHAAEVLARARARGGRP